MMWWARTVAPYSYDFLCDTMTKSGKLQANDLNCCIILKIFVILR